MTTFVLDETTERTPVGEVLRSASGSEIEITDPSGKLIARVTLIEEDGIRPRLPFTAGSLQSSRQITTEGVTTQELLEKLRRLPAE